ncbi:MAG: hypothetical protein CMC50_03310 [Flavobacteriaceae bacterium]|nr:hypothetical protein [Flavobacteriaceae bacterium]|tara:strand:- start:969 stop:1535 length:567 start_codon:yes stop_codon:yes gene_type:complete
MIFKGNYYILMFSVFCFLFGCNTISDDYIIQKGFVGKLSKNSTVKDLDSIFSKDSLVKRIGEGDYMFSSEDKYLLYDKLGNPLLTMTPHQQHDPNEKIESIEIKSPIFRTKNGLNILSTFSDIKKNHKISDIQNTINNLVIFVNEIDAYFIIDKVQLPKHLQKGTEKTIKSEDIPPNTKIKRFMIGWN